MSISGHVLKIEKLWVDMQSSSASSPEIPVIHNVRMNNSTLEVIVFPFVYAIRLKREDQEIQIPSEVLYPKYFIELSCEFHVVGYVISNPSSLNCIL